MYKNCWYLPVVFWEGPLSLRRCRRSAQLRTPGATIRGMAVPRTGLPSQAAALTQQLGSHSSCLEEMS